MDAKQLPVPPAVESDSKARELLRCWTATDGNQHVSLDPFIWEDPASWGIMLVDLAKHVASAYEQSTGKDYSTVLRRILEGFDAERGHATDEPFGRML